MNLEWCIATFALDLPFMSIFPQHIIPLPRTNGFNMSELSTTLWT